MNKRELVKEMANIFEDKGYRKNCSFCYLDVDVPNDWDIMEPTDTLEQFRKDVGLK